MAILWLLASPLAIGQTTSGSSSTSSSTSSSGTSSTSGTSSSSTPAALEYAAPAPLPAATNQYSPATPPAPAAGNAPVAPTAAASTQRPLTFRVGSSITWDSNALLLPDSADAQAQLGTSTKSDRTTAAYVGMHLDTTWRQQRFYLDATETAYRHQNFSYLDYDGLQYSGAWDWLVGPRLSGSLSASRSQSLVNYNNFQNTSQRNVVTSDHRALSLDYWASGGWHLLGGLTQDEVRNSVPFVAQGSYRGTGLNGGLRYIARSGDSIAFLTQTSRATYQDQPLDPVNLIDDGFRRTESDVQVSWRPTGKTTLTGQAGWLDYRGDHFSQRDFSGAVGQIAWQWQATGKVALGVFAARNLVPYASDTSSYAVANTVGLGPSWQITSKTALRFDVNRTTSDYRGAVVAAPGPQRSDTLQSARLGLSWAPRQYLSFGASLSRTKQSSNVSAFGYSDTTAQLNASLVF